MDAKQLIAVMCASVALAACNTAPTSPTDKPAAGDTKMCTLEAKQCPDGSYVGRDAANNCAFAPCPGTSGK